MNVIRFKGECTIASKPTWYIVTVRRLSKYQKVKRDIIRLEEQLEGSGPKTTTSISLAPGRSGTSDQVGNLAQSEVDKQEELREYEAEIRLIDRLIETLPDIERTLIQLRYLEENKDAYVQRIMRKQGFRVKSSQTYYNVKDRAVEKLAAAFGLIQTENEEISK